MSQHKSFPRSAVFWAALAFTVCVAIFLLLPVLLSILTGLTRNQLVGLESGLTLRWVFEVWADYRSSIWLSFGIALACLASTLLLGVPAAYVLLRCQGRWARTIEEMLMLPVALPGIATALALIVTYGAVGDFRTHWSFILVGHVLFTLPFMVRAVLAVMLSVDMPALEEAARSLGASFWQRFTRVVLPNCRSGIVAGALMVLTLSIGEFNMTLLLHTPLTQTLPVGLADAYASLRIEVGSAYTIVFFVMIVPLLIALQLAGGRRIQV
ncbi:ABC transporter permease subunit [Hydrogenophaga sp.]|uniref:ABC transporter permease n=1 Tax=Hydrogenophaga sp. TaxID=1904254 RepID=UPI0019CF0EE1|nr:ABC transporter permease subunit [Hydrogenophaga sp.]MBD3893850.1 ABC transporter permease subunit [Hydrogenophaga sp.]